MKHPMRNRHREVNAQASLTENTAAFQHIRRKNDTWQRRSKDLDEMSVQAKTVSAGFIAIALSPFLISFLVGGPLLIPVVLGMIFGAPFAPVALLARGVLTEHATAKWARRLDESNDKLARRAWAPVMRAIALADTPNINRSDYTESSRLLSNIWEAEAPYRTLAVHTPPPSSFIDAKNQAYAVVDAIIRAARDRARLEGTEKQCGVEANQRMRTAETDAGTEILARYIREDAENLAHFSHMCAESQQLQRSSTATPTRTHG